MPTNPADIIPVIAPELVGDMSDFIAIAEMQVAPGLCGDMRPVLVAYLAAHTATLGQRGGNAGGVSSRKEGQVSVGFAGAGAGLHATSYGMEFERMARACVFSAGTRATYEQLSKGQ